MSHVMRLNYNHLVERLLFILSLGRSLNKVVEAENAISNRPKSRLRYGDIYLQVV